MTNSFGYLNYLTYNFATWQPMMHNIGRRHKGFVKESKLTMFRSACLIPRRWSYNNQDSCQYIVNNPKRAILATKIVLEKFNLDCE